MRSDGTRRTGPNRAPAPAPARTDRILNLANGFTLLRVVLVVIFAWLLLVPRPALPGVAAAVFATAALTDSVDGYFARRFNQVTGFGEFLDPLADKLLIGVALAALVVDRRLALWVAIVFGIREVAVSAMRVVLARRGRSMPASNLGKAKTVTQIFAVLALTVLDRGHALAIVAITIAVALTLISGVSYFNRKSVPWR